MAKRHMVRASIDQDLNTQKLLAARKRKDANRERKTALLKQEANQLNIPVWQLIQQQYAPIAEARKAWHSSRPTRIDRRSSPTISRGPAFSPPSNPRRYSPYNSAYTGYGNERDDWF